MRDPLRQLLKLLHIDLYLSLKQGPPSFLEELTKALRLLPIQHQALQDLAQQAKLRTRVEFEEYYQNLQKECEEADPFQIYSIPSPGHDSLLRKKYHALLKGSRIALIGSCRSLIGASLGSKIDSHDLVVRVNFQWPTPLHLKHDLGDRIDILYHCCNGDFPVSHLVHERFSEIKMVCFLPDRESLFLQQYCHKQDVPPLDIGEHWHTLSRSLSSSPFTGVLALYHLLQFPIEQVSVYGFSFFEHPHYAGYKGKTPHERHDIGRNRAWALQLERKEPRVRFITPSDKENPTYHTSIS